jgi:anti-sigma regulatory factor (Ser/Thr protein kinase)
MPRPRSEPTTSISLFATRTDRTTPLRYTETSHLRYDTVDVPVDEVPALIRLQLAGILEHRDVALRAVSTACKLVTPRPQGRSWNEFQMQVVSAVGEAYNNVVLHGYAGRKEATIDLRIQIRRGQIRIELRDWGASFDPTTVPAPAFDTLPESGLGLYIMQSFMDMTYRPGRPNLLTLSKRFADRASAARKAESAT